MSRIKLIGLGLLAASLISAVGATSALADVAYWVVNGAELARGRTASVVLQYGAGEAFKITLNGQIIKITCNKATGEEELIGGRPGTDKYKTLAYFECSANTGATGCELVGGFNAEEFGAGKWLSQLVIDAPNVMNIVRNIKYKFELKNCTAPANNGAHIIDDPMKTVSAVVTNRTGVVRIVYKEESEEGFEIEGGEVTYSAEGEMEVSGGTLEFAEGTEEAPFWSVNGTRLVAGKTHDIQAKVYKGASLSLTNASTGIKITCTSLSIKNGVLLGSNVGEPGKDDEIIALTGCTLVEGNGEASGCALEGSTITTNQLVSEQVESVAGSKGGGQLLEELRPAGKSGLVTIKFTGGEKCTVEETIVSGSTVAEVLTTGEKRVELGEAGTEATASLLRFPATAIKQVWLISNGVGKIQKTGETSFGTESVQTGTALVLLANTKFEGESAKWSPLP